MGKATAATLVYSLLAALFFAALLAIGGMPARAYGDQGLAASSQNFSTASLSAANANSAKRPVEPGAYRIRTAIDRSYALGVPGGSSKEGKRIKAQASESALSQVLYLRQVSKGSYTMQAACSGLYLTDEKGKVVQRPRSGKKLQTWKAIPSGRGVELVNAGSGKRMALAGDKAKANAKVCTTASSSKATRFLLNKTELVPRGYYTIRNTGGMMLDVTGCSRDDGANVEVWEPNGSVAQVFRVKPLGKGVYRVTSDASGKALDVNRGSKADGANVQQWPINKTAAQKWRITMRIDGGLQFICKASGKALEAAAGGTKSGANVRQAKPSASKAGQGWYLKPAKSLIAKDRVRKLKIAKTVKQLIVVEARGTRATVSMHEKADGTWRELTSTYDGWVGASGVGNAREGVDYTPTGVMYPDLAFGIKDDPGCPMGYLKANWSHYWVGDSSSPAYNTLVSTYDYGSFNYASSECILACGAAYNYCLNMGWNSARTPGGGSAFFLHCSMGKPTAGCVSVPEDVMVYILQHIKHGCAIVIDERGRIGRH